MSGYPRSKASSEEISLGPSGLLEVWLGSLLEFRTSLSIPNHPMSIQKKLLSASDQARRLAWDSGRCVT